METDMRNIHPKTQQIEVLDKCLLVPTTNTHVHHDTHTCSKFECSGIVCSDCIYYCRNDAYLISAMRANSTPIEGSFPVEIPISSDGSIGRDSRWLCYHNSSHGNTWVVTASELADQRQLFKWCPIRREDIQPGDVIYASTHGLDKDTKQLTASCLLCLEASRYVRFYSGMVLERPLLYKAICYKLTRKTPQRN